MVKKGLLEKVNKEEEEINEEEYRIKKKEWRREQLMEKMEKKTIENRFKKKKAKMKIINKKNDIKKEIETQKEQEQIERKTSELKSKIVKDLFSCGPKSIKAERINYRNRIIYQNITIIKIIKYVEFLININVSYSHIYRSTIANTVKGLIKNIRDESQFLEFQKGGIIKSDDAETFGKSQPKDMRKKDSPQGDDSQILNELSCLHEYIYSIPPKNQNQRLKYIESVGRILLLDRNNNILCILSDEIKKIYDIVIS